MAQVLTFAPPQLSQPPTPTAPTTPTPFEQLLSLGAALPSSRDRRRSDADVDAAARRLISAASSFRSSAARRHPTPLTLPAVPRSGGAAAAAAAARDIDMPSSPPALVSDSTSSSSFELQSNNNSRSGSNSSSSSSSRSSSGSSTPDRVKKEEQQQQAPAKSLKVEQDGTARRRTSRRAAVGGRGRGRLRSPSSEAGGGENSDAAAGQHSDRKDGKYNDKHEPKDAVQLGETSTDGQRTSSRRNPRRRNSGGHLMKLRDYSPSMAAATREGAAATAADGKKRRPRPTGYSKKRSRSTSSSSRSASPRRASSTPSEKGELSPDDSKQQKKKRRRAGPRPAYTKAQTTILYRAHRGGILKKPGGYEFVAFLTDLKREQVQKWKYNLPSRKRVTPLIASLNKESIAQTQREILMAAREKGLTSLQAMSDFCTLAPVQVADWFVDCATEELKLGHEVEAADADSDTFVEDGEEVASSLRRTWRRSSGRESPVSREDHESESEERGEEAAATSSSASRALFIKDVGAAIFAKQQAESNAAKSAFSKRKLKKSRSSSGGMSPNLRQIPPPRQTYSSVPLSQQYALGRLQRRLSPHGGASPPPRLPFGVGVSVAASASSSPRGVADSIAMSRPRRKRRLSQRIDADIVATPMGSGESDSDDEGEGSAWEPTRESSDRGESDHERAAREQRRRRELSVARSKPKKRRFSRSGSSGTSRGSTGRKHGGSAMEPRRRPPPLCSAVEADATNTHPNGGILYDVYRNEYKKPLDSSSKSRTSATAASRDDGRVFPGPPSPAAAAAAFRAPSPKVRFVGAIEEALNSSIRYQRRRLFGEIKPRSSNSSGSGRGTAPQRVSDGGGSGVFTEAPPCLLSSDGSKRFFAWSDIKPPACPPPLFALPAAAAAAAAADVRNTSSTAVAAAKVEGARNTASSSASAAAAATLKFDCPCGRGAAPGDDLCRCSRCAKWCHRACFVALERRDLPPVCAGCALVA